MSHPEPDHHADHDHDHDHDHGHDHDHDHGDEPLDLRSLAFPVEGMEQITIVSAGLDVGSSTSHLAISRLVLRRKGAELSSEFAVAERTMLYRSPVVLTPYLTDTLIDTEALEHSLDEWYADAGLDRDEIDTGVVIVTGEAANRANAEPLARRFAARTGKFVCVTAGPHYEALLAAHGSGAVELSRQGATVLGIDMGGGTTKVSVSADGALVHTAAFSVGARLVAVDAANLVTRIEPPARLMLDSLGLAVSIGDELTPAAQSAFARLMTDVILDVVEDHRPSPLLDQLMITAPVDRGCVASADTLVFSGGVSEYVYGREELSFGDLGPQMGRLLRTWTEKSHQPRQLIAPPSGIRATVLGAGEHSLQASGLTSFIADEGALPVTGLKVVKVTVDGTGQPAAALRSALARFDLEDGASVVFAVVIAALPDYPLLRSIAEGLVEVASPDAPLLAVVIDVDVARIVGAIMVDELGWRSPIVVLDGLHVGELDYLDIGAPLHSANTVPVTVKSLTFATHQ